MLYSLASTAFAGGFVSVSMIEAGLNELESCDPSDGPELEEIIAELSEIVDNPEENSTLCLLGEDKDAGFATWLQDEDDEESEELEETEEFSNFDEPLDFDLDSGGFSDEEEDYIRGEDADVY